MNQQDQFSTRLGFILATAGSAIGLGAIWKFPYVAGQNGGGAFLFVFILFTFTLALPLMMAEFSIGRTGGADAVTSFKKIAPHSKWYWIAILGMVTCFILLSFYSVIGGWVMTYLGKVLTGGLNGLQADEYALVFEQTIANPWISLSVQFLFLLVTILVVSKGIQGGIEKAAKIMMPALAILFIILVIRALTLDGAGEGLAFLFQPDFSKLTSKTVLDAMGQSFFTLSIGVSVMVTYSSYLPKTENLPRSAVSIVSMNIMIVLLAGLAIFPAVFSFNLSPDAGPVLLFHVLPTIFSQLPMGMFFFTAFLIVFLFAALTSAFSMLEIIVSVLSKGDAKKRRRFAWIIGISIFIFGIPSALSYGVLNDFTIFNHSFFEVADYVVSNILMPLGALMIALFVSWRMDKSQLFEQLRSGSNIRLALFNGWYYTLRYIAPILIILVMLDVLGVWDYFFIK